MPEYRLTRRLHKPEKAGAESPFIAQSACDSWRHGFTFDKDLLMNQKAFADDPSGGFQDLVVPFPRRLPVQTRLRSKIQERLDDRID
jgi:hypothetical protein